MANLERDPVCGMQVDPARATAQVEHGGKTFYFCSRGCAQKFQAAPENYLSLGAATRISMTHGRAATPAPGQLPGIQPARPASTQDPPPAQATPEKHPVASPTNLSSATDGAVLEYTCPMHPEVRERVAPGKNPPPCPECGMALEALAAESAGQATEYVCPMHSEIVRDAPGDCPICGWRWNLGPQRWPRRRILS